MSLVHTGKGKGGRAGSRCGLLARALMKRVGIMHELPIINSMLKVVLKHAEAHKVKKVLAIHIQVGEMSDLEDEWMQKYLDYLATDEVVRGVRLVIERIPVVMECSDCGTSYAVDLKSDQTMACPECESVNSTMVSGREYFIKHLEAI